MAKKYSTWKIRTRSLADFLEFNELEDIQDHKDFKLNGRDADEIEVFSVCTYEVENPYQNSILYYFNKENAEKHVKFINENN